MHTQRSQRTSIRPLTHLLLLVALVGSLFAALVPAVAGATDPAQCPADAKLVPSCGVLWGWYGTETNGTDWPTSYAAVEQTMGRKLDIVKRYHDFSGTGVNGLFPNVKEQAMGADGRTLYFAWNSVLYGNNNHLDWAKIAAGQYDASVIAPVAQQVKAWGQPVFIDFDHEAGNKAAWGPLANYVAAYRHIHHLFDQLGVTNVSWVWVGTSGDPTRVLDSYPGDDYVDWVAYDPYNYYTCRNMKWRSPAVAIGRWYKWLQANGFGDKPYMLAEYGSVTDPAHPGAQAQWYRDLPAALKTMPNIHAVVEFHTAKTCNFRLHTDDALTAFGEASRDPYIVSGQP